MMMTATPMISNASVGKPSLGRGATVGEMVGVAVGVDGVGVVEELGVWVGVLVGCADFAAPTVKYADS